MSTAETELAQALDQAYAAYKRAVGRPRGMERLRHRLSRDYAAQTLIDDAKRAAGGEDNWKRLGDEARAVAEAAGGTGSKRDAAE